MGKLSTAGINQTNGTSKTLQPGNVTIKINNIELKPARFRDKNPDAMDIMIEAEGEPLGDSFEGFFIDKDDPSLGRYLGQCGTIRATEWSFSTGETKGGIKIARNMEILKFVQNLCKATDNMSWFDGIDEQFEDSDEGMIALVNELNEQVKDKWYNVCLAGKEYTNRQGYTNFDLFLPKFTGKGVPVEAKLKPTGRVYTFDPLNHLKKMKAKETVEGFDGGAKRKGKDSEFELN